MITVPLLVAALAIIALLVAVICDRGHHVTGPLGGFLQEDEDA